MAAGKLNINVEQGATFNMRLILRDDAGTLIDLTGWSFRGQLRATYDASTIAASFTATIPTQSGGDLGAVDLAISAANTALIPVGPAQNATRQPTQYAYDVEGVDTVSKVYRIVEGVASVSPEATR